MTATLLVLVLLLYLRTPEGKVMLKYRIAILIFLSLTVAISAVAFVMQPDWEPLATTSSGIAGILIVLHEEQKKREAAATENHDQLSDNTSDRSDDAGDADQTSTKLSRS